jgi:hypothetical protein
MSEPRREYDVYLESELSLGIACGELMVPPHAEVFKVREVIEGDTESDDEIERLRELVAAGKEDRKVIDELLDENLRLRELLKDVVYGVVQAADWERLIEEITREVRDE